ncbi:low molecular weight protein tyrosine phosphatase family protein [Tahibacter amnicola]|uniref:Low molecular weight protein tyrosine phosphatase family protein n=1 Tax=Tahibacter amnicola TaxID=2976241 RepID=A0ABY6BM42_9GAMM|nr:low molecular weight protein tyrosine phosphatase family protein [Tahibacter amnicola]UXI69460.1 low molecular weight protein tyrosine phosphatase family protein [Tahibacter amnicola]
MNILFVCSQNRLRSPTAEQVFAHYPGIETASAGTDPTCASPVCPDLLAWADVVVVMENAHRLRLHQRFRSQLKGKRLVCLDIPDVFPYMDEALVALLKARASRFLR